MHRLNNKGIATTTLVIIIVVIIVLLGGAIGGVLGYNAYQEKKQEETELKQQEELKNIEESRIAAVNAYNDRINQIVMSLNVEKNGTASNDNNEDVDAMANAVNELKSISNEVNNDTLLTQEQKDALNGTIAGHLTTINNRINVVNEKKIAIGIRDDVIELYKCSYNDLLNHYGSDLEEEISGGMEKIFYVKSLAVSAVYSASGGEILPKQYNAKRVEGLLKNIASNMNDSMAIDEFVQKLSLSDYDVKYELKSANTASPYTFDKKHYEVQIYKKEYVNPEENMENPGEDYNYSWGALLKISVDDNNRIAPDSFVWFMGAGGAL